MQIIIYNHRRLPQLTCVETDAGNWSLFCWHRWWRRVLGSGERRQGGDILGGHLVLARWQLPASKCSGSFSYKEQKTSSNWIAQRVHTHGRPAGGEPQTWQCRVTKDPLRFCHASSPWPPTSPPRSPQAKPAPSPTPTPAACTQHICSSPRSHSRHNSVQTRKWGFSFSVSFQSAEILPETSGRLPCRSHWSELAYMPTPKPVPRSRGA